MLRFGNPYTRDSSAAARIGRAAATAIAHGGRSGGVANENSNRDMTHRVVSALAQVCPCPPVVPAQPPVPPLPFCERPMTPVWARYSPTATPTWSLTDGSDGCTVCGYHDTAGSGEFFDLLGGLVNAYYITAPVVNRTGFVINFSPTGGSPWLAYMASFSGGDTLPLKIVRDASSGYTYVCGSWTGVVSSSFPGAIYRMWGAAGSSAVFVNGDRNNLFVGCLDGAGVVLWAAHVVSSPVGVDPTPVTLEAIDLAVVGGRVLLYGKISTGEPLPAVRSATFYDGTAAAGVTLSATTVRSPLFVYSLDATGGDPRVATVYPGIPGYVFGVNLTSAGAITGYALGLEDLQFTDSAGAFTSVLLQGATKTTGFVAQFTSVATLDWADRVIGALGPANTAVSTATGFAPRYQRGIVARHVYTGNYENVSGGISFIDGDGGVGATLPEGSGDSVYFGPVDPSGFHSTAWRADTSGGELMVLSSWEAAAGDLYFLLRAKQPAGGGQMAVLFYDASDGSVPAVSVDLPSSGGAVWHLVVKYSAVGGFQWVRRVGGINWLGYGVIAESSEGCVLVYGAFAGTLAVYDGSGDVLAVRGNSGGIGANGYLAKWTADGVFGGVAALSSTGDENTIWLNSAEMGDAYMLTQNTATLSLQNMVGSAVLSVPGVAAGTMTVARWGTMA